LSVYSAAPADATGIASGLFRTAQYVGANLAAAAIALVFAGPATDAGLHRLGLLVAVIAAILLVDALEPGPSRRIKGSTSRLDVRSVSMCGFVLT
jgi:sugar phosphate permease